MTASEPAAFIWARILATLGSATAGGEGVLDSSRGPPAPPAAGLTDSNHETAFGAAAAVADATTAGATCV